MTSGWVGGDAAPSRRTPWSCARTACKSFLLAVVALALIAASGVRGAEPEGKRPTTYLTAEALLERAVLTRPQLDALHEGKVVAVGFPRLELTPEQLAATLLVLVPAKVPDVAAKIVNRTSLQVQQRETAYDLEGQADDALRMAVVLGPEDAAEVERLLRIRPGDEFNFSIEEIGWFQAAKADLSRGASRYGSAAEAMTATLRRVLQTRYQAYRARGLDGVAPYDRGKEGYVDPAEALRVALDSIHVLRGYFPEFYIAFREYPEEGADAYTHRHRLIRGMTQGRRAFVLAHWMVDINENYALIAERQYYVTHTYDTLQNMIACLPYRGGTLVGLLNQTFTGKVAGFARGIRHDIGRSRIQETIRPLFELLRNAFAGD